MIEDLQQTRNTSEEKNRIEYVKRWIDDTYEQKAYYSFSLYTLELTRRFKNSYENYKREASPSDLRHLLSLTIKLEEKLMNGESL